MTPEQLDMHKRLQPLYKRVMGEWQGGDHYAYYLYDKWEHGINYLYDVC